MIIYDIFSKNKKNNIFLDIWVGLELSASLYANDIGEFYLTPHVKCE